MKNFRTITPGAVLQVLFQRPILFFTPLLIVGITLVLYTRHIKLYKTSGVVSFRTEALRSQDYDDTIFEIEQKNKEVITSFPYGESIRRVVRKAWPELVGKEETPEFYGKIMRLRSPSGLKMFLDRKNIGVLHLSYISKEPLESYQVVQAAIDTLIEMNTSETKKGFQNSIAFLKEELNGVKKRIRETEQKLLRVRSGLPIEVVKEHDQSMVKRLQDLTYGSASSGLARFDGSLELSVQKQLEFGKSVSELNFDLKLVEKEYGRLLNQLKDQTYLEDIGNLEFILNEDEDTELTGYTRSMTEKQQELHEFLAQGFREAHPKVQTLRAELKGLEELRDRRLKQIRNSRGSENMELFRMRAEQRLRTRIQEKKNEIELLKDRIQATEDFQTEIQDSPEELGGKLDLVSRQKAQLLQLENERLIATDSYHEISRRLDAAMRGERFAGKDVGMNLEVSEKPRIPLSPMPMAHLSLIVAGLLLTFASIVAVAMGIVLFDSTIHGRERLLELTGLPVVGVVSQMEPVAENSGRRFQILFFIGSLLLYAVVIDLVIQKLFL